MSATPPLKQSVRADVLVIGGGLAATMAALTARKAGARVVMLVKGKVAESGSSARSGGVISAAMGLIDEFVRGDGVESDMEAHIADTLRVGCDLCSEPHVRALAEDAPNAILELERLNVEFSKRKDGGFHLLKLPGSTQARGCSVIGGGPELMKRLRERLISHGVDVLENSTAVSLLSDDGRIVGARASGPDIVEKLKVFAPATVLASGGAAGLFETVSGDKRNTGDGLVLAYEAGAELANLEFVEFTLIFRVQGRTLSMAGLAPFLGRGGKLINGRGEPFMERYYPPDVVERAGRPEILRAVLEELNAHRGPIFIDCSELTESDWEEFERSQGGYVLQRIRESGGDYRNQPLEVVPAAHSILAGLVTDPNGATTLRGLWAAGEVATGVHGAARLSGNGLAACIVFGARAGRQAAEFAQSFGLPQLVRNREQDISSKELSECEKLNEENLSLLRDKIYEISDTGLGSVRDEHKLIEAHYNYIKLKEELDSKKRTRIKYPQELDLRNLAILGELMTAAALRRTESRGLHFRTDIPNHKARWRGWLIVRKDSAGEAAWSYRTSLFERTNLGSTTKPNQHDSHTQSES